MYSAPTAFFKISHSFSTHEKAGPRPAFLLRAFFDEFGLGIA